MKVLAIDCSAKSVSAAIADNGKLIAEGFLNIKLTHSETLMPIINQALENARLTLKDIDAFAITAGPGSFTGIRIGISAVKGMAFAEEKPVYSFSTLHAMALAYYNDFSPEKIICSLMDARRNQFYNALFKIKDGKITRLTDDRTIEAETLKGELNEFKIPVVIMGDGAELFSTLIGEHKNISLAPENIRIQRAAGIAIKTSSDETLTSVSPDALQAIYLRKSQAEREREEKLNK